MKAKELIELLQLVDPDAPIFFDDDIDLYEPSVFIEDTPEELVFLFKGRQA